MSQEKLNICQIQISPVDDGFVIQAQSIDGLRQQAKQIAGSVSELRQKLHKLVDVVYEPAPPTLTVAPTKPTPTTPEAGPGGPT